ncbi:GNAT family N-acetyltransferase [Streptomyces sp. c-19]|uniref:GNAT family N-acetyltransferase n=1 Tax=Streptomyces sp. c-19 TaxID=2789275 RepID=UPI00397F4DD8
MGKQALALLLQLDAACEAVDDLARASEGAFRSHPDAAIMLRIRRYQWLCLTRIGMVYGRVWVADDGRAGAVWAVPGQDPSPAFAELGPLLGELSGDRAAASETADTAMAPYRPEEPGWFLETVATAPEAQGKGLGSAVLIPGIQEAERAGYPAFLETSSEANVRFYERLGFKVTADVQLPHNGPRTWCMRRDPR